MSPVSRQTRNLLLLPLLALIHVGLIVASSSAQTANPFASAEARGVLQYLQSLKGKSANRLLMGQDLGHGSDIENNYDFYVENLEDNNGKQLGLIGGDYGTDAGHIYQISNQIFINQWNRGGLVTISWHFDNPWSENGSWDTSRDRDGDGYDEGRLRDLTTPGHPMNTIWRAQLDEVALQFEELNRQNVPVLFRPFHEMNGSWFWWGVKDANNPTAEERADFIALYQYTFNYLTYEKGLENLLWVYSTATTYYATSADFYPGAGYIDVVGIDVYDDDVRLTNVDPYGTEYWGASSHYDALASLGHPMGLTEFGPAHARADGSYNMRRLVDKVRDDYPDIVFSLNWHNYSDFFQYQPVEQHAINFNANIYNTLHDPLVANLSDIDLSISDNNDLRPGTIRLQNRSSGRNLAASSARARKIATAYNWRSTANSMKWELEPTNEQDVYRLRCYWKQASATKSNYLHATSRHSGRWVRVYEDQPWTWQKWKIERDGDFYRLKNVVNGQYLNAEYRNDNSDKISTYEYNAAWWSQQWEIIYVD